MSTVPITLDSIYEKIKMRVNGRAVNKEMEVQAKPGFD